MFVFLEEKKTWMSQKISQLLDLFIYFFFVAALNEMDEYVFESGAHAINRRAFGKLVVCEDKSCFAVHHQESHKYKGQLCLLDLIYSTFTACTLHLSQHTL